MNSKADKTCGIRHAQTIPIGKLKYSKQKNMHFIWFGFTILQLFYRNLKQKMLNEIADVLGVTAQDVSAKFHALRTQFNRECSREKKQKSGSSSDENYVSKWEYMSSLQFLKINAVASVTISNLVA